MYPLFSIPPYRIRTFYRIYANLRIESWDWIAVLLPPVETLTKIHMEKKHIANQTTSLFIVFYRKPC